VQPLGTVRLKTTTATTTPPPKKPKTNICFKSIGHTQFFCIVCILLFGFSVLVHCVFFKEKAQATAQRTQHEAVVLLDVVSK
jgi:hypothetical protein